MRFRPLTRHDAWRSIPQTLCMRGIGLVTLALCGLLWPDLALIITLVDIGIICLLFALADLFVAAAIRRESTCSARKIGALGLLGLTFGALDLALVLLPLQSMRAAALIWLVASGIAIVMLGESADPDAVTRKAASLRKQFERVKQQLRGLAAKRMRD